MNKEPTSEFENDPQNGGVKGNTSFGAHATQSEGPKTSDTFAGDSAFETGAPNKAEESKKVEVEMLDVEHRIMMRKRKKHHAKRKKILITLAIIVAVLLAIAAGIFAFVWWNIQAGEEAMRQVSESVEESANKVEYNGHTYEYNENIVSVVFIGFDRDTIAEEGESAGQSDAVMVLALDTSTGEMTGIGIPRDSMVEVDQYVGDAYVGQDIMQLCLAFSYGNGSDTSAENTTTTVSRILYDMPMTYYFAMDLSGVSVLNNAIGGVSLTPLESIPNTNIEEGEATLLYGNNALKYVQWRDTSSLTSSLDRQARQVQYIEAFASQALTTAQGDVTLFVDLYNKIMEYSVTNLGMSEFSYLASTVVNSGISSVDVVTLQGEVQQSGSNAAIYLDETNVYETVLDVFYTQID